MSGLIYLVGAILLASVGLTALWLFEKAPLRDSLSGVHEFERARRALRRRHSPGGSRNDAEWASNREKGERRDRRDAPSTVKILR